MVQQSLSLRIRDKKMFIVSKCLIGVNCKYNGTNNINENVIQFLDGQSYVAVCPEEAGGLPCPRPPAELLNNDGDVIVINIAGEDVTDDFERGASVSLKNAVSTADMKNEKITGAILKANSPSCGCGTVYDGTFTGAEVPGNGIFAEKLIEIGIPVATEKNYLEIFEEQ